MRIVRAERGITHSQGRWRVSCMYSMGTRRRCVMLSRAVVVVVVVVEVRCVAASWVALAAVVAVEAWRRDGGHGEARGCDCRCARVVDAENGRGVS